MDSDSDAELVVKTKRKKFDRQATDRGSQPDRNILKNKKGWEAKKQKREKRQQRLLEQIDKKKTQEIPEVHDEDANNESSSKKKSKKKRRLEESATISTNDATVEDAVVDKSETNDNQTGRKYTVSIAVSGSIIDNAQSPPLKAYLAGQVARAAAIFQVDEVIVYDDTGGHGTPGCEQMARVLQFLECPQYLRKDLFPIHPDLQSTGLIAPLDIPHHLRKHEALPFREGVVSKKPTKDGKDYSLVNVGLDRDCRVLKRLPQGVRVTIKFENSSPEYILKPKGKLKGIAVSPHAPRRDAGIYWGYTVRLATCLEKVFSECPFREGYDIKVGTSEKGSDCRALKPQNFNHLLIVFGGVEGLEYALENDESLVEDDVSALFDHYVNTCPNQGSRTIRTEEAILISMTALSHFIEGK